MSVFSTFFSFFLRSWHNWCPRLHLVWIGASHYGKLGNEFCWWTRHLVPVILRGLMIHAPPNKLNGEGRRNIPTTAGICISPFEIFAPPFRLREALPCQVASLTFYGCGQTFQYTMAGKLHLQFQTSHIYINSIQTYLFFFLIRKYYFTKRSWFRMDF